MDNQFLNPAERIARRRYERRHLTLLLLTTTALMVPFAATTAAAQTCVPTTTYANGAYGGDGSGGSDGGQGGTPDLLATSFCGPVTVSSSGGNGGTGSEGNLFHSSGNGGRGGDGGNIRLQLGLIGILTGPYGMSAISTGGNGGNGGDGYIGRDGGSGALGGNGGNVSLGNAGAIQTSGLLGAGLYGKSVGGAAGAGGSGSSFFGIGGAAGAGGQGGNSGQTVSANNSGSIQTTGNLSNGISLISLGGSGGEGASSLNSFFALGGNAGPGGDGGTVTASNGGTINTSGYHSKGLSGLSVGGGGGEGGSALAVGLFAGVAIGGYGGHGGNAGAVTLDNNGGTITTTGISSTGIKAQSIGGGGGDGGLASAYSVGSNFSFSMAMGRAGGGGGNGGAVSVTNNKDSRGAGGIIQTGANLANLTLTNLASPLAGDMATGILAQSIGGGGGSGGNAFSASAAVGLSNSLAVSTGFGGSGGASGAAGNVTVSSNGSIQTSGRLANGITAQSIGGGGGHGGNVLGVAAAGGETAVNAQFNMGGTGGTAGGGQNVGVVMNGSVLTVGQHSAGVLAQSVGGGGGAGGNVLDVGAAVGVSAVTLGASLGGKGGAAGDGGTASISTGVGSTTTTYGDHGHALIAQSVGGGGGSGGSIHSYSVAAQADSGAAVTANFNLGGSGTSGGYGGAASVTNSGALSTAGANASAVLVQSIGGGGGNGGNAFGLNVAATLDTGESTSYGAAVGVTVGLGGVGGVGGDGGAASFAANSSSNISTSSMRSSGVVVQSIGGGGGDGGHVHSFSVTSAVPLSINTIFSRLLANIPTKGFQGSSNLSAAVNLGGKGGVGGAGGTASASLAAGSQIVTTDRQSHGIVLQSVGGGGGIGGSTIANGFAGVGTYDVSVGLGGTGGQGGTGGVVTLAGNRQSTITTSGDQSYAVLAQSVGGGGGEGGSTHFRMPSLIPMLSSATISVGVGGNGGGGNTGGTVTLSDIVASTSGKGSSAIVGQSIGGGGGVANVSTGSGLLVFTMGGKAGTGGDDGGTVTIAGTSATTSGDSAIAIHAQSIGGGGGIAGLNDIGSTMASSSFNSYGSLKLALQGGAGKGGAVSINCASATGGCGAIQTSGALSFGLLAQSIGGGGGLFSIPNNPVANLGASMTASFGQGASGGVTIADSAASPFQITTSNAGAIGIVAQALDNGGGALTTSGGRYQLAPITGTAAGSANAGIKMTLNGSINTSGDFAHGIFADTTSGSWTQFGRDGFSSLTRAGDNAATTSITLGANSTINTTGANTIGLYSQSASTAAGAQSVTVGGAITSNGPAAVEIINNASSSTSTAANPAVYFHLQSGASLTTTSANGIPLIIKSPGFVNVLLNGSLTGTGSKLFDIQAGNLSLNTGNATFSGNFHLHSDPTNLGGAINTTLNGYTFGSVTLRDYVFANVTVAQNALLHSQTPNGIAIDAQNSYNAANGQVFTINGTVASEGPTAINIVNNELMASGGAANPALTLKIGQFGKVQTDAAGSTAVSISTSDYVKIRSGGTVVSPGRAYSVAAGSLDFVQELNSSIQGDVWLGNSYPSGPTTATFNGAMVGNIFFNGLTFWYNGSPTYSQLNLNSPLLIGTVNVFGNGSTTYVNSTGNHQTTSGPAFSIDENTILTITGNVAGDVVGKTLTTTGNHAQVFAHSGLTGSVTGNIAFTPIGYKLRINGSGPQTQRINIWQFAANINDPTNIMYPVLGSLPRPTYQPMVVTAQVNGVGGIPLWASTLITRYSWTDDNPLRSYDSSRVTNWTIQAPSIDFTRANLTGNLAKLAGLANAQVAAAAKGAASGPDAGLEKLLVQAANANDVETVSNALQSMDTTSQFSMAESTVSGAVSASETLHSCGGQGGAALDPIAQGQCHWAKISVGRDRRHGSHQQNDLMISLGRQMRVGEHVVLGLTAGYDETDFRNGMITSMGNRLALGGVAKYFRGKAFGAVSMLGSYGWADGERRFADPTQAGVTLTARSDQKSWVLMTRLRAGYLFDLGGADLTAMTDLDLPYVHDTGYTEIGAGSFNLKVASTSQMLVDLHPRVRLGKGFKVEGGAVRLYGELGRRFAFNDVKSGTGLANGFDASSEAAVSFARERSLMSYGAGLIADIGERMEARIAYDLLDGKMTRNERFTAKLALKF